MYTCMLRNGALLPGHTSSEQMSRLPSSLLTFEPLSPSPPRSFPLLFSLAIETSSSKCAPSPMSISPTDHYYRVD